MDIKQGLDIMYKNYDAPRDALDENLVYIVYNFLYKLVGHQEAEIFKMDPSIAEVYDKKPEIQRIIINRFFSNLLLKYRSMDNTRVVDAVIMLPNDGTVSDWLQVYNYVLYPFLKNKKIFEIVYGISNSGTAEG